MSPPALGDSSAGMSLRRVKQELRRVREHAASREAAERELGSRPAKGDGLRAEVEERRLRRVFKRTIDEPLHRVEEVLSQRERLLREESSQGSSGAITLEAFKENVLLDRYHFVGFAINLGFGGINSSLDDFGTALHHAVRRGNARTVEELLRHGANADAESPLGSFPVLDVWVFYKSGLPRARGEERGVVALCGGIFRLLAEHGAFVDHRDLRGWTSLMHAALLGVTDLVVLLLGLKADPGMVDAEGRSAADLAGGAGHLEVQRLLSSWPSISAEVARTDFRVAWSKFLRDPTARIDDGVDVTSSLGNLDFQLTTLKLSRPEGVRIDDSLLREVRLKDHENGSLALHMIRAPPGKREAIGAAGMLKDSPPEKGVSELGRRRQVAAKNVARDGKFLEFTRRPATSSALLMSLRKPSAPLVGTAEENDEMRRIGSQGPEHELARQLASMESQIRALPFGRKPQRIHGTNSIGAYDKGLKFKAPTEKQSLMAQLSGEERLPNLLDSSFPAPTDSSLIGEKGRFKFVEVKLLPRFARDNRLLKVESPSLRSTNCFEDGGNHTRGRLQCGHNSRGVLEKPWAYVEHNYRSVNTDRTV